MNAAVEEKVEQKWAYQNDRVYLFPYVEGGGSKVFHEDILFVLHQQCKRDGILGILFPGMPQVSVARFVSYLKDRPVLIGTVRPNYNIVGFGFLYEVEGSDEVKKATVGFCFFKEWWGRQEIKDLSQLCLEYWFNEVKLKVLFGTTLWRNRLAWRFAKSLGFESIGRVPKFFFKDGKLEDMHMMYITPEMFMENQIGRT
jgi:RimJ/RimL family protein N-acetyltransferase